MNLVTASETWTPEKIRALREARRQTQEEFATEIGVSFSTLNRWENGHARPTKLSVRRLEELTREAKS